MLCFHGVKSLILAALFPPTICRMVVLIFGGCYRLGKAEMKHQELRKIIKVRIVFQFKKKSSEMRSNPRPSLLCIQKWYYVITLSHCAFFMTDLKQKNSSPYHGDILECNNSVRACLSRRVHFPRSFVCIRNNWIYIKADVLRWQKYSVVPFHNPMCC